MGIAWMELLSHRAFRTEIKPEAVCSPGGLFAHPDLNSEPGGLDLDQTTEDQLPSNWWFGVVWRLRWGGLQEPGVQIPNQSNPPTKSDLKEQAKPLHP